MRFRPQPISQAVRAAVDAGNDVFDVQGAHDCGSGDGAELPRAIGLLKGSTSHHSITTAIKAALTQKGASQTVDSRWIDPAR